jgi:hypothetical protein
VEWCGAQSRTFWVSCSDKVPDRFPNWGGGGGGGGGGVEVFEIC